MWPFRAERASRRHGVAHGRDVGRADGDEAALVGIALHRDDAAADRQIVLDQDEAAGGGVGRVLVEREQALGAQHDLAGAVALDPVGGPDREVARVDDALDRLDRDRGLERAELERVAARRRQRLVAEPEQARLEDVGLDRRLLEVAHDLAALDEDLLVEGDADALPGPGLAGGLAARSRPRSTAIRAVLFEGEKTTVSPTCEPARLRSGRR